MAKCYFAFQIQRSAFIYILMLQDILTFHEIHPRGSDVKQLSNVNVSRNNVQLTPDLSAFVVSCSEFI